MAIVLFYGVFLVLALVVAATAYHLARPYGPAVAITVTLGVASVEALLFPIPIHGGFTFLLEVAVDELKTLQSSLEQRGDRAADRAFLAALETRFASALSFERLEVRPDGWTRVIDETGAEAWLAADSGLVWRGPLIWERAPTEPSLEEAEDFCAAQPPTGRWALPTDGELLTLWSSNGHALMPGDGRSSLTRTVDTEMTMELQTKFVGRVAGYSLGCVARSEAAPRRGYISEDFSLVERNRFQLQKTQIFE